MNPTILRNPDGSYTVSAIIAGYREKQIYIGYTRAEALSLFCRKYGI